jgi:hypothetical protein
MRHLAEAELEGLGHLDGAFDAEGHFFAQQEHDIVFIHTGQQHGLSRVTFGPLRIDGVEQFGDRGRLQYRAGQVMVAGGLSLVDDTPIQFGFCLFKRNAADSQRGLRRRLKPIHCYMNLTFPRFIL